MIITISGKPGSGKSSVAKLIADKLKLKHYSMGDLQRKYAKEKGITIEELCKLEAKDPKIDKDIDNYQTKLSEKEDNFIIDGRLSFYFIPRSIKIYLDCSYEEGAKRIYNDTITNKRDSSERKTKSFKEAKDILIKRVETDRKRFLKYYKVDFLDLNNYDLVVDTTNISKKRVSDKIIEFVKNTLKKSI